MLTTLNVNNCIALDFLNCSNNELTNLDVSTCTALKDLTCYNNKLTTLDVSKCSVLADLWCKINPNLTAVWLKTGQNIPSISKDANTTIYYKD